MVPYGSALLVMSAQPDRLFSPLPQQLSLSEGCLERPLLLLPIIKSGFIDTIFGMSIFRPLLNSNVNRISREQW